MNKLPDLIKRAKEIGLTGMAITNHDNLSEIVSINKAQKQFRETGDSFQLAIGNEIYLIDKYANDENGSPVRQSYHHFILIAKNRVGLDGILELSSRAWYRTERRFSRRRIPTFKKDIEEVMSKIKGNVIATSACLGGEIASLLLEENYEEADAFLNWCVEQFGDGNFYIELQPHQDEKQMIFNKRAIERYWGKIPFTVGVDAHYLAKEDFPTFEAFLRSKREGREVQEFYGQAYLMTPCELREYLSYLGEDKVEEMIANSNKLVNEFEFYDLSQKPYIPEAPIQPYVWTGAIPSDYPVISKMLASQDIQTQTLISRCLQKLTELNLFQDNYLAYLEEECDVFDFQSQELEDNFFKYFNTAQYYVEKAWSVDCAVGPSRGSASGSMICYLLGITQIDPIKNNLYLFRFANKVRASMLDIDLDHSPSKRPALFEAIRKERGELGLVQVATFKKLTLKAAIGTAGRGYRSKDFPKGLDPDITTYLSSLIEVKRGFVASLEQTLNGDFDLGFKTNHRFIKEVNSYPGLMELIRQLENVVVNSSTHAAAVVYFDLEKDPITNHCSLMRAPNGDLCVALDLSNVEEVGCIKMDLLLLSTLDIQATTFQLLQKDGKIPAYLTLRECFDRYIDPNKIDTDDPRIWDLLYSGKALSVFQWEALSGKKGIARTKPRSLAELSVVNGLIRLMTAEGEEDQIERFCRIKENPTSFRVEMVNAGLSTEQIQIMEEELNKYNGVCAMQESFMILLQQLAGYSLAEADKMRKIVAKKKMADIESQKDFFYEKTKEMLPSVQTYLWKVLVQPSLGYAFNLAHSLPYSLIGVQCLLLSGIIFEPIYWQTACLLQQSGALDGKTADYNKIAKAVASLTKQGVDIRPINVNTSNKEFTLMAEKGAIYFGFDAVKGVQSKAIEEILAKRPFSNLDDFLERVKIDITSLVALTKAGGLTCFENRKTTIEILASEYGDVKKRLNGQNLLMLSRKGYWPTETEELQFAQKVFNFNVYLKKITKENGIDGFLDDRCCEFLDNIDFPHDGEVVDMGAWNSYYQEMISPVKDYLKEHQEEMLALVNQEAINEWKEKYFGDRSVAYWEIETLGICFHDHPFVFIRSVEDFNSLPQDPIIIKEITTRTGRTYPIFDLTMIAGIAIAKDKLHSMVTILTPTGPVDVKLRKEQFSHYDSQISCIVDGKKKVIEKSWLNRGTPLIVHGMRQDDHFVGKTYKKSAMEHAVYKISGLKGSKLEVQKERKNGTKTDATEE